ncbi:MAG: hypothetical protein R3E79_34700 [Caldilineaceae bacterium]
MSTKEQIQQPVKTTVCALKPTGESSPVQAQQQIHPGTFLQSARRDRILLSQRDILQLQHRIGNQAVNHVLNLTRQKPLIQQYPAAQGYPGRDEDFLRDVLSKQIQPQKVRMREGIAEILFMIDFAPGYQCQIHIHESSTGKINAAHIKSNAGNIRHSMNFTDAVFYLEWLNELHANSQIGLEVEN